jgi:hypothetical protein
MPAITALGHIQISGLPIAFYFGIATLLSLLTTATIGLLLRRGIRIIPFPWHMRMAAVTVVIALVHATLVIWQFFF